MSSFRIKLIISFLLILAILAVYWPVGGFDFISYDDGTYVFQNPMVLKGWSLEGLKWAFTTNLHLHWHPLTWLSLMTDSQLFGINPGAYHLVSLLIHIFNTLLLFHILIRMTGDSFCSAFAAALFGLHPLHVESVAWIADRKDVLVAFFWMTALWLYFRYVRKPGFGNGLAVFASLLLALMAKSTAVTLPVVFLILDYWPLKRFVFQKNDIGTSGPFPPAGQKAGEVRLFRNKGVKQKPIRATAARSEIKLNKYTFARLLVEKAVFFLPMIIGAISTVMIVQRGRPHEAGISSSMPSLDDLARAVSAYGHYLYKMIWPAGLAIPYPKAEIFPVWETALSLCLLLSISFLAYRRRMKNPYLLAGWLWYLVTLLPVIGLVQGGPVLQADRYTYVPLIGIFIMLAWGAADLTARYRYRQWILGAGAGICILSCAMAGWKQVGYWKNTVTIFGHSVQVTRNNDVALNNLGFKLLEMGRVDEAITYLTEAVNISPNESFIHVNLGNAQMSKGDLGKAAYHYQRALEINPKYANASYNLANIYLMLNKLDLSEKYFLQTIENDEQNYMAHTNLGAAYSRMGKSTEAIAQFRQSIKIQPRQYLAYFGLGLEHLKLNELEKAEIDFNKVLEFKPDYERAYYELGMIMLKRSNYDGAIRYFAEAWRINPQYEKARQSLEEARIKKMGRAR